MKTYLEKVNQLTELRAMFIKKERQAKELCEELDRDIEHLRELYKRTLSKDDRHKLKDSITELEDKLCEANEVLEEDYELKLLEAYDQDKLNELEQQAKEEHISLLREAKQRYEEAERMYHKARDEYNIINWHSDYKKARKRHDDILRILKSS